MPSTTFISWSGGMCPSSVADCMIWSWRCCGGSTRHASSRNWSVFRFVLTPFHARWTDDSYVCGGSPRLRLGLRYRRAPVPRTVVGRVAPRSPRSRLGGGEAARACAVQGDHSPPRVPRTRTRMARVAFAGSLGESAARLRLPRGVVADGPPGTSDA